VIDPEGLRNMSCDGIFTITDTQLSIQSHYSKMMPLEYLA